MKKQEHRSLRKYYNSSEDNKNTDRQCNKIG